MRKLLGIAIAGVMSLALAGPAMAGPNIGNFSSSLTMAQAGWSDYDEETGRYRSGYLAISRYQGDANAFAEYSDYSEQWIQCTGADTPDNPDDDTFGFLFGYLYGWSEAELTIGKNNGSAHAEGVLPLYWESLNECTGEWTFEAIDPRAFSMDLTATSATIRESGRGSFHLPSEYNSHSSYRATYRNAEGTVTVGDTVPASGMIGKVSWMDHTNG